MARRRSYHVEAWRGMECVDFASVVNPATVVRRASHYALDKGADRVYVHCEPSGGLAGQWQATGGWVLVHDERLAEAINAVDK